MRSWFQKDGNSGGLKLERMRSAVRSQIVIMERHATLAQLVERLIRNQQVAGSIPAGGSRKIGHVGFMELRWASLL